MIARLVSYSREKRRGILSWCITFELVGESELLLTESLSLAGAVMIADAHIGGPLYELCRAIRDARDGEYEHLIGVEFCTD